MLTLNINLSTNGDVLSCDQMLSYYSFKNLVSLAYSLWNVGCFLV